MPNQKTVDEILQDLCSEIYRRTVDNKLSESDKLITQALSDLRELVESKKKVNSWAETKSDGDPLISLGFNQAIDDVLDLFK